MFGFGGAITDAAAYNVYTLSPDVITNLINSYFDDSGKSSWTFFELFCLLCFKFLAFFMGWYQLLGLQYNIIRVTVGGVDFSMREYTYDDVPNDFNLTQFKLGPEDIKWKIPFIQTALKTSKKPLKLFASAWTAPPWMKTNGDYRGNGWS